MTERRRTSFEDVVDRVVEMIQEHGRGDGDEPKRKLGGEGLQKLEASVRTLIRDSLGQVYDPASKGEATIHLRNNWYSSPISPRCLTYRIHVGRAFEAMTGLGLLEITKRGVNDRRGRKDGSSRSHVTRYRATDALVEMFGPHQREVLPVVVPQEENEFPIRVRIKDGPEEKTFPAPESDESRQMAENLYRINRTLARSWYDLEIPDRELAELQRRLAKDEEPKKLALHRRQLYRVFNDAHLSTGGRFYGGWWQNVPSSYRRYLSVNGKGMVEIDYSNIQPVILYAWEEAEPPKDCYRGIFDQATERSGGLELRNEVKAALNAMLNAERELARPPDGVNPSRWSKTWQDFSAAIVASHTPIAHHFYTGVGRKLQRADSDIAEAVMLKFVDQNDPILPIHDSFLVHQGHRAFLEASMKAAMLKIVGVDIGLKLEEPRRFQGQSQKPAPTVFEREQFGFETTQNLDDLLSAREGHERRLDAFLAASHKNLPARP